MKHKHVRRLAAAVTVAAVGGVLVTAAQPAVALASPTRASVRAALLALQPHTGPVGQFPTIAVVRGPDRRVYATTGNGFVNLGGQVLDDPAVAADGNQIWFLAEGTNRLLYVRSTDTDWQLVQGSPILGTSLTAAFDPTGSLLFSFLDGTYRVRRGVIDITTTPPTAVLDPVIGPSAYGAAINSSSEPLFVNSNYVPGLLGPYGDLKQWLGGDPFDPANIAKRYLNCAHDRLGSALAPGGPNSPVGAVVCRSGVDDSVHFLGNSFLGYGLGRNLGGHIIGSPGVALENNVNVSSVVYATGTNHHVFATSVLDRGGIFTNGPWVDLGGYAVGGVQAASFTLT